MKLANLRDQPYAVANVLPDAKEAIVDCLLNLTWQRVSGSGVEGNIVYGGKPSLKFVSGFLLPRFAETGLEDETSDIHISTHGLDFQVDVASTGVLTIAPRFSIYVRSLPTWEELASEPNGIFPRPPLRKTIETAVTVETRRQIAAMRQEDKQKPATERRDLRRLQQEIYRALLAQHGVRVSTATVIAENDSEGPTDTGSDSSSASVADEPQEPALVPRRGEYLFETDAAAQPVDVPEKWQRLDIVPNPFSVDLGSPDGLKLAAEAWSEGLVPAISEVLKAWLNTAEGKDFGFRPAKILPSNFKTKEAWEAFLTNLRLKPPVEGELLPNFSGLRLMAETTTDFRDPSRQTIRILFENNTRDVGSRLRDRFEPAVHLVNIEARLPAAVHRPLNLDRVEPSYRFRHFLSYAGIGVNCGVISNIKDETLVLRTTWMPRYVQPRIVPTEVAGFPIHFAELGGDDFNPAMLRPFVTAYEKWIQNERASVDPTEGAPDEDSKAREAKRFSDDLDKYETEAARVSLGIELLVESHVRFTANRESREAIPYKAWLLLNRTFAESGKEKNITSWRLFQMAFILAHLPTLASRMKEFATAEWFAAAIDEETATLLYFPTGGGKSEAFFGLLVFNLFFDRLRGKSIGITALLRYPLRLLTLQQAQRLLKIIIQAEFIRRSENIVGATFEIGYWVGRGNTPNSSDDDRLASIPFAERGRYGNDDKASGEYDEVNNGFNKVGNCPICGAMTGLRRIRYLRADEVAIVCFNQTCAWNLQTQGEPLPFLIVDSDIYRHAPSVLLGVIDKLALIGQHPSTIAKVLGMFGFAKWMERDSRRLIFPKRDELKDGASHYGCVELAPAYASGHELFHDPYPSLIIQDEAHLLEESLGTFAGLFETLLEELLIRGGTLLGDRVAREPFGDRKPRLAKVIAATATVSVPQQQFGALYQRDHMHFPYPGTSIFRSFYSVPALPVSPGRIGIAQGVALSPEIESPWMRVYVSLMTNGRNHTVTTTLALSAYHLAISELWDDLLSEDRRSHAVSRMLLSLSDGPLKPFHEAALSALANNVDVLFTLVDLMRISLTYVTNKKGGDQVIDAFRDEVKKMHTSHARDLNQFSSRLISGGVDVSEIQEIMRTAEGAEYTNGEVPTLDQTLRNIVATSAISHGVDVDKFNAMFFAGMPTDIAEFIQASSRVGRTHPGFCLLIPTPHARRDRYIVETHDIYHRFLERMIAPPAITRWAAAAHDRVLASGFQAWLCGWVECVLFVRAKSDEKNKTLTFQTVNDVNKLLVGNEYPKAVDDFMNFAVAALGIRGRGFRKIGGSPRPEFYEERTRNNAKRLVDEFRRLYTTTRLSEYWPTSGSRPPMTSLRDIDEAARFVLSREFGPKANRTDDDKRALRSALRIVRNQNGRVAELDEDED